MPVPLRRISKPVTSQENSFRCLPLVELFNCVFAKPLAGSFAQPMPTELFYCKAIYRIIKEKALHIPPSRQCEEETASHDVARNDITWSIGIYPCASIK